jgi:predicted Zn-dependent protease
MKRLHDYLRRMTLQSALVPLVIMLACLSGCVTDPVTGQKKLSFLSHDQEIQLGQQGDAEIIAQYGVYDDAALAAHVSEIGQVVAAKSDDPSYPYTFRILNTADVNAFALPGGFVYVTRGLLAYLENDAQLAMVLGHEIGHVNAHHTARQMASSQLANLAIGIGGAIFADIRPFLGAAQVGLQLLFLKYSRDDEREADELGVRYATRAGYQASEGAKFFQTLVRIENQQQGGALPEWESTHPGTAERVQTVTDRAAYWAQQTGIQLGGVNPETYVPLLQNIIYGQNPREGFVQSGTFYLPELAIQFPVPSGWDVGNLATQVQMAPQAGDAAIVMTAGAAADPRTAAQQFVDQNQAQVISSGAVTVNGLSAYRVQSNISVDDGNGGTAVLTALSYFISSGNNLFVFHGYSTQAQFGSYASTFESVFSNVAPITNSAALNVQPRRLTVFQAPRSDQFQSLVQATSEVSMDDLAILNQVQPGDQIQAGTYLKQVQ